MKKLIRYTALVLLALLVVAVAYVVVLFPPVMNGMNAKTLCSCVFVAGRTPESVMQKELAVFPGLNFATTEINTTDSTVTSSLLGRTSKAIFRRGLGCTLLAEESEAGVRSRRFRTALPPRIDLDTVDWPDGNRLSSEPVAGVDYSLLGKAIDGAFADADPAAPVHTHGVVIVYNGHLIGEKYASGFDYDSRQMGWSMTKSIANALVGILAGDGKLTVEQPAPVPEWMNDERRAITLNHLLQATSGLSWQEGYFVPTSDFHQMFTRSDDKAAYAASLRLEHEPGTFFEYSSGSTNILSRIIRQSTGDSVYHRFPYERLFHKIGMHTALLEPDASGTFVASSYCWASARDWARFGLLYLNDGVWRGERILPAGWVRYSTTPNPVAPRREYGAQIWLNAGRDGDPGDCYLPGLPNEAILFEGFEENSVVLIPSRNLVVVRLGVTHNRNFSLPDLVNGVIAALPAPGGAALTAR